MSRDDELLFDDADDANSVTADASGFITHTANVHYDNLIIDGEEIPAFAVEPNGKLATGGAWGQLKTNTRIQ